MAITEIHAIGLSALERADAGVRLTREEIVALYDVPASDVIDLAHDVRLRKTDSETVTFSIGMCTYEAIPSDFKQIMQEVDRLMYGVKETGRDGIRHEIRTGANDVQFVESPQDTPLVPEEEELSYCRLLPAERATSDSRA